MQAILQTVDHTLLKPTSTWSDIKKICDEAKEMQVASVCIPPAFVGRASDYLQGAVPVCTVIGFPLGYQTTAVKVFEAKDALSEGADEIDMVVNIGEVKEGHYDTVEHEIKQIKQAIGDKILKVIIEACYLTEEEKIAMCHAVTNAGADFIKTSTGFGTGGATLQDITLFAQHIGKGVQIKAAGGVKSIADAKTFIDAGATRLGTSSICQIIKDQPVTGY